MEREIHLLDWSIPDLATAFASGGIVLAKAHPEALRDAMRVQRQIIGERMASLPEPMMSATYAHILMHHDGSAGGPWSLLDRDCVFGTASSNPAIDRMFVSLEDTVAERHSKRASSPRWALSATATTGQELFWPASNASSSTDSASTTIVTHRERSSTSRDGIRRHTDGRDRRCSWHRIPGNVGRRESTGAMSATRGKAPAHRLIGSWRRRTN